MSELYRLKSIRRVFGEREVLNIPALTLQSGVIYGLQGPNGAGKTTLMRILSFMDTPTAGSIVFLGTEVRPDQAARYRARVVWVPQSPVMFTGTLLYNVEYPMRLKRVGRQERRERALALLDTVGLRRLARAPAPRLSGGEAQRASIARALAAGAEVILFDEPTASVDFHARGEIIRLIRQLNAERKLSLIVTTHDAALAAELCRERIILFDGKIVPQDPFSDEESLEGEQRAIPWPATLDDKEEHLLLLPSGIPPASFATAGQEMFRLTGLAESSGGILLRLASEKGAVLSVFLNQPDDLMRVRRLTLGALLRISS